MLKIKGSVSFLNIKGNHFEDSLRPQTDISAEPERFMDGHVHKGILRSAEFLVAEIKACLKERLPRTGLPPPPTHPPTILLIHRPLEV